MAISSAPAIAASHLVDRPVKELFIRRDIERLAPAELELAEKLEVYPLLKEITKARQAGDEQKLVDLRERLDERIMACYFDAASVIAEADREQVKLEQLRERLISRRDRKVETNSSINFISSGALNSVGSALAMPRNSNNVTGNVNQLIAGVVSTGLSGYALKQGHGERSYGWGKSTVLAELFGRPTNALTVYPESVWRFLHGKMPNEDMSRVQFMEDSWQQRKLLEPEGSHRQARKLDIVCGVPCKRKDVSIDDLSDQIDMVADVSTMVGNMINQLRILMRVADYDLLK